MKNVTYFGKKGPIQYRNDCSIGCDKASSVYRISETYADWAQEDPNEPNYIVNKPFYDTRASLVVTKTEELAGVSKIIAGDLKKDGEYKEVIYYTTTTTIAMPEMNDLMEAVFCTSNENTYTLQDLGIINEVNGGFFIDPTENILQEWQDAETPAICVVWDCGRFEVATGLNFMANGVYLGEVVNNYLKDEQYETFIYSWTSMENEIGELKLINEKFINNDAVFRAAMLDDPIELTDEEKHSIKEWLGVGEAIAAIEKDIADNRDAWVLDTDTRYSFSTDGDKLVVKKALYTNGVAGTEEEVGKYKFLTADEVDETLKGYYTKGEADELVQGAKDYADNNDANTEYHVEYDSINKKIKLVAGADVSKMEIDATDFIKDGMIKSVELVTEDDGGNRGQFLKIVWNTDAGVGADDVTYVNVTTLVDIYVGENGDYVNVTVTSDNKIKADLTDAAKTKLNKVWEEVGVAAGLDATLKTELQKEIDDDIVAYNTSKNFGDIITHNDAEYQKANDTLKHIADNYTVNELGHFNEYIGVGNNAGEFATLNRFGVTINSDTIQGSTNYNSGAITRYEGYENIDHTYNLPTESGTIATHEWVEGKNYLTEIITTANEGLKVTNKNQIDIDTDVVFVLDCNW